MKKQRTKAKSKKKIVARKVSAKATAKKSSKPGQKKAATKKVDNSSRPKVVAASPAKPVAAAPVAPVAPGRAPRRSIIGDAGKPLSIVPKAPAGHAEAAPVVAATEPVTAPAAILKSETRPIVEEPQQKYAWSDAPRQLPASTRFFLAQAERECQHAEAWPFPFGKFIHSLPQSICGLEFGLLSMRAEHDIEALSKLCAMDPEVAAARVSTAREHLVELFSSMCGDIERKWRMKLSLLSRDPESAVEQYALPKVDRHFQALLSRMLIGALSPEGQSELPSAALQGRA